MPVSHVEKFKDRSSIKTELILLRGQYIYNHNRELRSMQYGGESPIQKMTKEKID
jgi:hypothetical protein